MLGSGASSGHQGRGGESGPGKDLYLALLLSTETLNKVMDQEGIFYNMVIHTFHKTKQSTKPPFPATFSVIKTHYSGIEVIISGYMTEASKLCHLLNSACRELH